MCAIFSRDRYVKLLSDTLAFREYQHTLLCNEAIVAVAEKLLRWHACKRGALVQLAAYLPHSREIAACWWSQPTCCCAGVSAALRVQQPAARAR